MALTPYAWHAEPAAQLALLRERLPNAVLLYGAPGTGVFELGRAFATSLLCESPAADGTPCGRCRGCELVRAGSHPDFKPVVSEFMANVFELPYVSADNERSGDKKKLSREVRIHQVRALTDFIGLAANRGGRRVVLVYPADMVREEAASALLKSMEEPPEGLVFILCAEDIDAVLPTIRSRSRLVRVPLPTKEEALQFLRLKKVKNPEAALALAGGAPLAVLKDDTVPRLATKAELAVMDLLRRGDEIGLDAILRAYPTDLSVPALAMLLSRWSHDLVRTKSGVGPRYFVGEADAIERLAQKADASKLWDFLAVCGGVRRAAEHPLNARQVWEAVFIRYRQIWAR